MNDLLSLKREFCEIVKRTQPWILSHFVMWLDLKLAEYKVYGYMVLEQSIDLDCDLQESPPSIESACSKLCTSSTMCSQNHFSIPAQATPIFKRSPISGRTHRRKQQYVFRSSAASSPSFDDGDTSNMQDVRDVTCAPDKNIIERPNSVINKPNEKSERVEEALGKKSDSLHTEKDGSDKPPNNVTREVETSNNESNNIIISSLEVNGGEELSTEDDDTKLLFQHYENIANDNLYAGPDEKDDNQYLDRSRSNLNKQIDKLIYLETDVSSTKSPNTEDREHGELAITIKREPGSLFDSEHSETPVIAKDNVISSSKQFETIKQEPRSKDNCINNMQWVTSDRNMQMPRSTGYNPYFKIPRRRTNRPPVITSDPGLICTLCGATFKFKSSLSRHKALHGEKRYHCSVCPKSFHRREHLLLHLERHSNHTVFSCPVCRLSVLSLKYLEEHHRLQHGPFIRTGVPPYIATDTSR